jgi:hypothetical protein
VLEALLRRMGRTVTRSPLKRRSGIDDEISRTRWIPMLACAGNCPRLKRKLKSTAFAASAIC